MRRHWPLFLVVAGLLAACGGSTSPGADAGGGGDAAEGVEDTAHAADPLAGLCEWTDHADNPLIEPPDNEFLIGDPSVIPPWESPDDTWHLFANSLLGIHHYVSGDGLDWERIPPALFDFGAFRPHVHREGGDYWLLFEQYSGIDTSELRISHSQDLFAWSEPDTLLVPELDWEKDSQARVGNPYLLRRDDGEYWLYYTAGGVPQEDTGFAEPRHIGVATADDLAGPWTHGAEPILSPSDDDPWRNQGAGSMKLLREQLGGRWIAFNNGLYVDEQGSSRSAILVLWSDDGLVWEKVCPEPVVRPEADTWKHSFVYAFDSVRVGDTLRLYYNARDGWEEGTERIGLATAEVPAAP